MDRPVIGRLPPEPVASGVFVSIYNTALMVCFQSLNENLL